jgi:DNA-binding winged helix-turn-helix (wHTH) protein
VDLCAATKGIRLNAQSAKDMLKQHIFGLRGKLSQDGKYVQPIENVRGQGYRIVLGNE